MLRGKCALPSLRGHIGTSKPLFSEHTLKVEAWGMEKSWTSQTLHQDTFGLGEGIKLKNFLLYFLHVECHTTQFLVKSSRYHEKAIKDM